MRSIYASVSALALLVASPALGTWAVTPAQAQAIASTYTVEFALGSAALDDAALATVAEAASSFLTGESPRIDLVGHTDTTGSADFNQELSERRAVAVRDALVLEGVPADAITLDAVGQSQLIVPTPDGVAEQANRVVVANVLAPEAPPPTPMAEVEAEAESILSRIAFGVGPFYAFDTESDGNWIGGNITADYFITDNISVGGEQAVYYTFSQTCCYSEGVGGRSMASVDYHFGRGMLGQFSPYIGANLGGVYGRGLKDSLVYGPEIGFTLWGIDAKVAYDIRDDGLDESIIAATLGWNFSF
jgi:hypothetical protein